MAINLKIKRLIAVVFLGGFSSFVVANTTESAEANTLAPEISAADAKLPFKDIPILKTPFIDSAPAERKDGIPVGELGVDGGNKDKIVQLAQDIADLKYGRYDSLLIAHKGKLLFESYYLRGYINLPHPQASATKSYTSLTIGRAIQLGYLRMNDLDKPLISFLKDLDTSNLVEGAELITLHKAMSMRSGIRISEEQRKEFEKNPDRLKGQGQVQVYLENSQPISLESQSFLYGYDPDLVMQVLDAVVPDTAKDFIENELLNKMGITDYDWETNISGLPEAGWRVNMTSRNMIKFGTLAINKGKWNSEQLIPEKFLAIATGKVTKTDTDWIPDTYFYGYYWYQTSMTAGEKSYDIKFSWGGGGQYVIAIEELDLVVVITGHDSEDTILPQILERILPTFAQ